MPGPHVLPSTLRHCPCKQLRITRGRCGSLIRHRPTLSLVSPRRFIPAHEENPMSKSPQSTSPNEQIIQPPRLASASALSRHFADLRDGTHTPCLTPPH